ncbi:MAG: methylenetetrahydrofolate--tRNA-(uracil(54)-C(5))-methyltransferase (FADH(2)-oxidizing) TrmFO [Bacilli bacterium]|jgi:methylenetetrahydrofolate--tRNA-(uracil-5-)-methyltransferase|nr:methylenetetrahydrofolate--tRNA-(uracil(54)-C(5))-methyltransferase (FADH(2)-oxidizing) TrmFO [Bacilli bacterium]MDD2682025.1 methylenetetrahydrofolate--tRNA-(uracil(54)-C(5))-methyltransferase (FADH(2)-oxidizing) TrmFO [Bacilli bacterium]MDD3121301.1 methylenetetrahydrofolate--tRNA-(uracil(54)-C(5))-methyltransferase (FADH(2)-oxidizing) TrmFO [Bacilli bacterium]MDD4063448.1 methylenetetrahydrofolate--tRNA-(uracil(54)-C(5))-methyltransferase (FADH(2)-oxidizing) TrmFO [Bacilli bacterium]MDD44
MKNVNIIGAGLAGCEAAYQLAKRGIKVKLFEMRPKKNTEVHKTSMFSELVCSNSFRAISLENAVGLIKEEMRILDSLIMKAANYAKIEAGGALAVDRDMFSSFITNWIMSNNNIEVINEEITEITNGPTIIATGPLTSDSLAESIKGFCGEDYLYFYDAIAPIVLESSIDKEIAYLKSRYDIGEASYYNCPMNKDQYNEFYDELIKAERVMPKEYELKVFEGCMAIEDIAERGRQTLLFGPFKPVGLTNPKTGDIPYAVVQLRKDNLSGTLYNIVGFQTHLTWPEQKRIIRMIPGLEKAQIVRYGIMHRNTFIKSPEILNVFYQTKKREDLFFAGQITGVEGYIESASSGMVAGINMYRFLMGLDLIDFTSLTAMGSLPNYISTKTGNFQPMNVNFGIFAPIKEKLKKKERKVFYLNRSLKKIEEIKVIIDD